MSHPIEKNKAYRSLDEFWALIALVFSDVNYDLDCFRLPEFPRLIAKPDERSSFQQPVLKTRITLRPQPDDSLGDVVSRAAERGKVHIEVQPTYKRIGSIRSPTQVSCLVERGIGEVSLRYRGLASHQLGAFSFTDRSPTLAATSS